MPPVLPDVTTPQDNVAGKEEDGVQKGAPAEVSNGEGNGGKDVNDKDRGSTSNGAEASSK